MDIETGKPQGLVFTFLFLIHGSVSNFELSREEDEIFKNCHLYTKANDFECVFDNTDYMNIRKKLETILGDSEVAMNLEKGIFNSSLGKAKEKCIVKKWDNKYFVLIYLDLLRTVYINLKDERIRNKMKTREIQAHKLAFMTHQEMSPEKWDKLIEDKKIRDENKYEPKLEASTDKFTCRKCRSKKCTYYQLQTRSADEPMTTFVTCLDCGKRWKC
jgi:transcription elongation factor S-II